MITDRHLGSEWTDEEAMKEQPSSIDESKGLFLFFSFAGVVALISSICFVWYFIQPRLTQLHLDTVVRPLFFLLVIAVLLNHILVVLTALFEKNFMPFKLRNGIIEVFLFEFSQRLGKLFGISKDRIGNSFVKVNNSLVRATGLKKKQKRLLVLLPRCMQFMNCKENVVEDIENCKNCGKCNITQFKVLGEKYNFFTHVATGGTLARKKIKEFRPSAILAVACERELVSGIADAKGIPVVGLPNERDEGPCKNTKTDINKVCEMISFLIDQKIPAQVDKRKMH